MLPKSSFLGPWVGTLTPFNEKGEIMPSTILAHYDYLADNHITGIIPLSPWGEFASLTYIEKVKILRELGQKGGQMMIMPMIGETSLQSALDLLRVAESAGADAVVLLAPYFYRPIRQNMILNYFKELIQATRLPVFIVHKDPNSQIAITPFIIQKFTDFENFYGVIDAGQDLEYFKALREKFPDLLLLSGNDATHTQWVLNGADGFVSSLGNAYPGCFYNIWKCLKESKASELNELQSHIRALQDLLMPYPSIDVIKYALYQRGFPSMTTRLPLEQMTEDQKSKLKTDLGKFVQKHLGEYMGQN